MTTYESIYPGAEALMPKYNPINYETPVSHLGVTLDPRTANQLGELGAKLNPGAKHVEIQGVSPNVWEAIPKQHLDEIRRQLKLAGVTPSLHGPVIEASGIGEKGTWQEETRLGAEKQLQSTVLRSHQLDPKGNISVTVHSTAQLPEFTPKMKTEEGKEEETGLWVINSKSGQANFIPPQERYFPEKGKFTKEQIPFKPADELTKINEDTWAQELATVNRYLEYGEQEMKGIKEQFSEETLSELAKGMDLNKIEDEEDRNVLKNAERRVKSGGIYLREAYRSMKNTFDMVYENASGKEKEKLNQFANEIAPKITEGIENDPEKIMELGNILEKGIKVLGDIRTPKIFTPLQEFVVDKSAKTFANVAESAYNKYGNTAPILNIENPPAGGGLSRAEDLKELVQATRKKLTENLEKKGMSNSEAKQVAEKMVGATWDVGHINMLRKKGYSEKDVIKQTEIIAPFVKHVHLSDNFGLDHTELPMGMGNVPLKEMMKKLGEKGFEGKKIIEAGDWWQHFAERGGGNPFKPTVEAFDSSIYAMKAGPGWSETGAYPGYFQGHGPINTPIHHRVYGAGFEALPMELGGQIPGDQSRFAGTPNQ